MLTVNRLTLHADPAEAAGKAAAVARLHQLDRENEGAFAAIELPSGVILAAVFLLRGSKGGIVCGCYRAVPPILGCARLRCSWKVNSHNVPPMSLVLFSLRRSLRLNSGPNKLYQES